VSDKKRRHDAARKFSAKQAHIDEAARHDAPRQIGSIVRSIDGKRDGTIEQITDDKVMLRLSDGSYIWIDRSTIL
jgi:hypothetical protein